jgi:hypothetical protein
MIMKLQHLSKSLCLCAGVAMLAIPVAANAQLPSLFPQPTAGPEAITFNFATPVSLSPTEQPGSWYPDRFPPCLFSSPATAPDGTKNTLEESICASNFQTPAPSFFNTQGRKYDLVANTTSISIDLYVPASWATTPQRAAGAWGTVIDNTGGVGDYPIIEFQGPITATSPVGPSLQANGGVAGFYGWDNTANGGNGGFVYIGLPAGFQYNSWVTLTETLKPGVGFEYTVYDAQSHRGVSIQSPLSDTADTAFSNEILEGYNYGNSYNIFWNNFSFVSSSFQCSPKSNQPQQQGGLFGLLGFLFQQQQKLINHPW